MLKRWEELPPFLRREEVRPYYAILEKRRLSLSAKRVFDAVGALALLLLLSPVFGILAVVIGLDSPGPVFYRQNRVTQYGRQFTILKFRTMVVDADCIGPGVTVAGDPRLTRVGAILRKYRLDELPQLVNVLTGSMSFVGPRPEVPEYVAEYTPQMLATLLLPAGITSEASIRYKDEDRLLSGAGDPREIYLREVLPGKMAWNLRSMAEFSFFRDLETMARTVFAVAGRHKSEQEDSP